MAHRCAICDYTADEDVSNATFRGKRTRSVRWQPKYNEYQCDDCAKSIKITVTNYFIDKPKF